MSRWYGRGGEDDHDDEWEVDEWREEDRADEDDRHDEALEQSEEVEEATEHVEENTRELVENQERFAGYLDEAEGDDGGSMYDRGGYQTEEEMIHEEREIESSVDGIDDEWEEFFDDRNATDDDTERDGGWF